MPLPFETLGQVTTQRDRRHVEEAVVEVRVAFAHEGGFLADSLNALGDLLEAHAQDERSSRLLRDIIEQEPRLAAEVATLRRDHDELPMLLADLRRRLSRLRYDAAELCDRIVEHHHLGDRLAYDTYITDLGGSG